MFVDIAKIHLKAGDGGNGAVSFHREKYVAAGGPDGGDGGRGGDIIFVGDSNLSTLADFRYKRKYVAENGENGRDKRCSGKSAPDLIVKVPLGTLVKDAETGRIIADISSDEPTIIAKGGKGGWGNNHFATSTRQVPRFAKSGFPGEELDATLELKLLADVGLAGFPNVGKSTLISVISEAKPKIANYHFTTLTPVLGVVRVEEGTSFVVADIPGLVEGASDGVGLGHSFLRHIERCRMIVHVVDISGSEGRDPFDDFEKINRELELFNPELAEKVQIVAGNKCDIATEEQIEEAREFFESRGHIFFPIAAATKQGVDALVKYVATAISQLPPVVRYEAEPKPEINFAEGNRAFNITVEDGVFCIEAPWLLKILENINPDDYESLQYFQRVLQQSGIIASLRKAGVHDGDTIRIDDIEFDYVS